MAWGGRWARGASGWSSTGLDDLLLPTLPTLRGPVDTELAALAARRAAITTSGDAGLKGRWVGEQGAGARAGAGAGAGHARMPPDVETAAAIVGGRTTGVLLTTVYLAAGANTGAGAALRGEGITYSMRATGWSPTVWKEGTGTESTTTVSMVLEEGFLGGGVGFECGPRPKLPQISCETDAWDLQPPPFPKIAEEEERRKMEVAMQCIMHARVHS